jgi:hypothetical protein
MVGTFSAVPVKVQLGHPQATKYWESSVTYNQKRPSAVPDIQNAAQGEASEGNSLRLLILFATAPAIYSRPASVSQQPLLAIF